jgi:hypothetical protein
MLNFPIRVARYLAVPVAGAGGTVAVTYISAASDPPPPECRYLVLQTGAGCAGPPSQIWCDGACPGSCIPYTS